MNRNYCFVEIDENTTEIMKLPMEIRTEASKWRSNQTWSGETSAAIL